MGLFDLVRYYYNSWTSSDFSDITSEFNESEDVDEDEVINEIYSSQPDHNGMDAAQADVPSRMYEVDAVSFSSFREVYDFVDLNREDIARIECSLNQHEMVSLLFLIYEDNRRCLNDLVRYIEGLEKNPLLHWNEFGQPGSSKKIFEGLTAVQNFQVLKTFGYKKDDLLAHYCPYAENIAVNIDPIKKIIFCLCEKLQDDEIGRFLSFVKEDFAANNLLYKDFNDHLEVYFLYWASRNYINIDKETVNLYKIYLVFKQMEKDNICNILTQYIQTPTLKSKCNTGQSKSRKQRGNRIDNTQSVNADLDSSLFTESSAYGDSLPQILNESKERPYRMNPDAPGLCLIINQKNFYLFDVPEKKHLLPSESSNLEEREGTDKDKTRIKDVFTKLGFRVIVHDNLEHDNILKEIKQGVNSVKENESSLFIFILSHGEEGVVFGCDSCKVEVSEITSIMAKNNTENLSGKPKILIIQACQGRECIESPPEEEEEDDLMTDGPSRPSNIILKYHDMLVFWATVPGFGAIRNKKFGSWFIQTTCDIIENNCKSVRKQHLIEICTSIIREVTKKKWEQKEKGKISGMLPIMLITLSKNLYFPDLKIQS